MKIFDNITAIYTLDAEAYTTDTTGTDYVDTQGYGDGMLLVASGDIGTASGDLYTITLKECETTNGTYTSTGITVTYAHDGDNTVKLARISDLGTTRMRYLRADLTCSATTIAWEGAVAILLGEAASGPVNSD